jgi:TM2 domain-containing membrane protein YozV
MREKVWVVRDPDGEPRPTRTTRVMQDETQARKEKSPAAAYTLSTLFWGAGQLYNGQRRKGAAFLFFMVFVGAGSAAAAQFLPLISRFLVSQSVPSAEAFLAAEALLLGLLIFWKYNAGDAYHCAAGARRQAFTGVQSRFYPFLCSLLVPGWGQFLNAQPVKGSIYAGFSIFSFFTLITIPAALLAWPSFAAADARFIIEAVFSLTVLFAPLIPLVWIIGSFDALRVSMDELKKERFIDRLKYANNRRRNQGWVRGVFPRIKLIIFLSLVCILLAVVVHHYCFPKKFYSNQIAAAQEHLRKLGMTLVPDLIDHLREVFMTMGK